MKVINFNYIESRMIDVYEILASTHNLLQKGFQHSNVDAPMNMYNKNHDLIVILIYVDDILIIGSNSILIQSFIDK